MVAVQDVFWDSNIKMKRKLKENKTSRSAVLIFFKKVFHFVKLELKYWFSVYNISSC